MPTVAENRAFLTDLFAGPFRGHAVIMSPQVEPIPSVGDVSCPGRPVSWWVDHLVRLYETRVAWRQAIGDDAVPYAAVHTGTHVFAAAFGCDVHVPEDSPAMALPRVTTAEQADALDVPSLDAPPLDRVFEAGHMLRERVGPDVPIAVPDIQSPLDIAALVWRKEDFLLAMIETPDAVERLIAKTRRLLIDFLAAWREQLGEVNFCHCPYAWAPPELGVWLSEDEVGEISTAMFDRFALPSLSTLSDRFGGLFVHCCATADHQYAGFRRVPRLRGLNRVFQTPGARPAIEAFTPETVLMMAWFREERMVEILGQAMPETRMLFNMPAQPLEESKATFARMRERCPRSYGSNSPAFRPAPPIGG